MAAVDDAEAELARIIATADELGLQVDPELRAVVARAQAERSLRRPPAPDEIDGEELAHAIGVDR